MSELLAPVRPGTVTLRVASLTRARSFYEGVLGLDGELSHNQLLLRPNGASTVLVALSERPDARRQPVRAAGLFHLALLVPTRRALSLTLKQLMRTQWPLQGASDHGVSEALYLADPDGNGLEIYADRPRATWPYEDGRLAMSTDPLDAQGLLRESPDSSEPWRGLDANTVMGHVHLRVPSINDARELFSDVVGLDVTSDTYPAALFLSSGGYHHHIAVNTWGGEGVPPLPQDAAGLEHFELVVAEPTLFESIRTRATERGFEIRDVEAPSRSPSFLLPHRSGITLLVRLP